MQYVILTDLSILEAWQSQCDVALGYPEPIENLTYVGAPTHAPKEIGRAMHFAEVMVDQTGTRWALPFTDAVSLPEGAAVVDELPSDWCPVMDMGV
jgi:hypothetical protein